jgi:very-short-patch-repair endonuclease
MLRRHHPIAANDARGMSRITDALGLFDGIATRNELIAAGIRGPEISSSVRAGEVRRIRRAHYGLPAAPARAIAAVRVGGRLGCVTAARSYGIWVNDDETIHVSLPANAARLRTNRVLVPSEAPLTADRGTIGVDLHWSDVAVSKRAIGESAWRVPLARSLEQLAKCAPRVDVLAAFESAVQTGQLGLAAAQQLLDATVPDRLGAPILWGLDGSGAETYLAETFRELGIRFTQQVPFSGVGFVDFLVDGRLIVEVDGYRYHEGRDAFRRDRRRDAALLGRGVPTLRIPADLVIADRHAAARLVVDALNSLAA